jgi:hypothetical protein
MLVLKVEAPHVPMLSHIGFFLFYGKQHQCCFISLRGVNEYKELKNEKKKTRGETQPLQEGEEKRTHHLNRTTEGEEYIFLSLL